jgi:uncharacterized protein
VNASKANPLLFPSFFYDLREHGFEVSSREILIFYKGLIKILNGNLNQVFLLGRLCFAKRVETFDLYERIFLYYFADGNPDQLEDTDRDNLKSKPWHDWLKEVLEQEFGISQDRALPENLMELLKKRLEEQQEAHQGGNKWIGTGGTSPFGHSGKAPGGFRVGGKSKFKSAQKVFGNRTYYSLREDQGLDEMPVQKLLQEFQQRQPSGFKNKLDLPKIFRDLGKTGEIIPYFSDNQIHRWDVTLLMDNGGTSMLPFAQLCRNMAAGLRKELRNIKELYFHNTIYEDLFTTEDFSERISLTRFLQENPRSLLFFIGDGAMAPSELFSSYGSLHWDFESPEPSYNQLQRIRLRFSNAIWLNPLLNYQANLPYTAKYISELFPMYPLTLAGLHQAFHYLKKKGALR